MNVDFQTVPPKPQAFIAGAHFHSWLLPSGAIWAEFYRSGSDYILRFPDLADFYVDALNNTVLGCPAPDVPVETVEHLYLNQVLPLALSRQGALVLHGSAVQIDSGCVAFIGDSGRGKSTLAASFGLNGHRCLTDDGLLLEVTIDGYNVLPSHPSIRLWGDSEQSLMPLGIQSEPPPIYSSKGRFLAGDSFIFSGVPLPLTAVYFLGNGSASSVAIDAVTPRDVLMELTKNSFLLETQAHDQLMPYFDQLADLANQNLFYRLDYPRRYEDLPRVRQTVIEHALESRNEA